MEFIWIALIGVILPFAGLRLFAADVYDVVIVWMTARWYKIVFERCKPGDRIFDVGIGTATALVRNKALLLERRLSVVGIDYEAAYVRKAEAVLRAAGLWRPAPEGTEGYRPGEYFCRVAQDSVYDAGLAKHCYEPGETRAEGSSVPESLRFDAIYFSGSFSVLPDPPAALRAVAPLLKAAGRIYITQTFQKEHSPFMAFLKPLLKYITTIDFGRLTTEADLERMLASVSELEVLENAPIEGSVATRVQTAKLVVLKLRN